MIQTYDIRQKPSVPAAIAAVLQRHQPAVLDSADAGPGRGRYTIITFDPVEVVSWQEGEQDPFEGMRQRLSRTTAPGGRASCPPFEPEGWGHRLPVSPQDEPPGPTQLPSRFIGWIGYFSYEAGRYIERLPATTSPDIGLPIAHFALYDSAAVHDARTGRWTVIVSDANAQSPKHCLEQWRALLAEAREPDIPPPPPSGPPTDNMTYSEYLRQVAQAREYIAAGDIFQVNFARRETYDQREPPWMTYLRLRKVNPAAYAACLAWEDAAVLSASPELFLRLNGRQVISRPIKGTRARSPDPAADALQKSALATSEKDRAELAMIVDLVRNDLGRVCEYGSVRVATPADFPAHPYELETHPTVHHLVAAVTGTLANGRDAVDLVRACFPGGSITGAPKVRAMQIIDELEPTERSVYTGSIGMFGLDGSMTLNIAIRTLIVANKRIHIYAGGGIVADSVPDEEYKETQAKARGMRRAMGINT